MTSESDLCDACRINNHGNHERNGRCLYGIRRTIPTAGSSITKTRDCRCDERPDPPPHNVMHTNTSPLYFPAEVTQHILELAQGGRDGTVQLDFGGGKLKAWKLGIAGRDRDGVDPSARPIDIHELATRSLTHD